MIIGLTGYKQAGKDSSAQILIREFGFEQVAFADALREMALAIDPILGYLGPDLGYYSDYINTFGYEQAKQKPEVRSFLQRLGKEAVRDVLGEHTWVDVVVRKTADHARKLYVVSDVRFPNEAAFVKERGQLWRIVREGQVSTDSHDSERLIDELPVDLTITASNLGQLHTRICSAWAKVVGRMPVTHE